MKKISTAAAKQSRNFSQQKLTIGFDLGDRSSWYCVLDEAGSVLLEQRVSTTPKAMKEVFEAMPGCRIALETGMHSPWVSRLLSELGHEVIVAHARNVRLIGESRKKDDRLDAQTLARLARIDPQLLSPVKHRSAKAQADLTVIRARAGLVRARTALVNTVRGLAKSYGERLRGCNVRNMNPEKAEGLSPELQRALEPLLAGIESLSERIGEYNEGIEKLAQESYPQVARLKQVKGVGTLIALTYLTEELGAERAADAHQQGRRSVSANVAGAGGASHSRSVWNRQRSAALGFEAGRARRKEWEEASGNRDRTKAGGFAAPIVGQRRGLRTAAQQPSESNAGGSISQNHS
jgi:transposase